MLFCSVEDIAELWKKRATDMIKGVTKLLHGKDRLKNLGPFTWERKKLKTICLKFAKLYVLFKKYFSTISGDTH